MLPRDRLELLHWARKKGFLFETTGSGHIKITDPATGKFMFTSSTPKDRTASHKIRMDMKKYLGVTDEEADEVVRRIMPLPEPKLVVDRSTPPENVQRDFLMAPKKAKRERGEMKRIILDAITRLGDKPQGVTVDDIFPRVGAAAPGSRREVIGTLMANYVGNGLVRVSQGRYRIQRLGDTAEPMPSRRSAEPAAAPQQYAPPVAPAAPSPSFVLPQVPIDMSMDEDYQILERALSCLADVEKIIHKHKDIARVFAGLKGALGMMNIAQEKPNVERPANGTGTDAGGNDSGGNA